MWRTSSLQWITFIGFPGRKGLPRSEVTVTALELFIGVIKTGIGWISPGGWAGGWPWFSRALWKGWLFWEDLGWSRAVVMLSTAYVAQGPKRVRLWKWSKGEGFPDPRAKPMLYRCRWEQDLSLCMCAGGGDVWAPHRQVLHRTELLAAQHLSTEVGEGSFPAGFHFSSLLYMGWREESKRTGFIGLIYI